MQINYDKLFDQSYMAVRGYKDYINGRESLYVILLMAEHPNTRDYSDGWDCAESKVYE